MIDGYKHLTGIHNEKKGFYKILELRMLYYTIGFYQLSVCVDQTKTSKTVLCENIKCRKCLNCNLHTINHFSISVAFIKNKMYEGKMQLKAILTPIILFYFA